MSHFNLNLQNDTYNTNKFKDCFCNYERIWTVCKCRLFIKHGFHSVGWAWLNLDMLPISKFSEKWY